MSLLLCECIQSVTWMELCHRNLCISVHTVFASVRDLTPENAYVCMSVSVCLTSLLSLMCGGVVFCSCALVSCCSYSTTVLLSVSASLFFLLHGSLHAAVLSVPPAGVWLASYCFLPSSILPACAAFTLPPQCIVLSSL